ncbi:MAG: SusC/RagA family TonB-linked outer membrane protein [Chloroflexota bacterium]
MSAFRFLLGSGITRRIAIVSLLACIFLTIQAFSQGPAFLKGKITDKETGQPLTSASVSIPALRLGAITDNNGAFTFEAPPGIHTVEVRYLGYETQNQRVTLVAGQTAEINVALSSKSIQTNEIVVVGLTGEVDRNKLGNTIGTVTSREIANVVSPSAIDALSGRVTGLNVTRNSGTPGAGTYITIRGRKSIMGSSEPLYVVDGVILDNSSLYDPNGAVQYSNRAVDINPQDIESIQILKGASAAAIYGSQAANGVILITTKKGKLSSYDKPAQITYNSSYTMDEKYGNIAMQRSFGQKPGTHNTYNLDSTGKSIRLPAGTPTYQQDDVPFRTGWGNEQSLSIMGGVPQFDYLINGTYNNLFGYVRGSSLERTSLRANVGISLFPGVTVQTNSNFISTNNDLPQDGSNTSGILLGALRTPPEFNNNITKNPDGTQHQFWVYDNPIWTEENNKFNSQIERFLHSTELKWLPFEWVSLTGRFGMDRYEYINRQRLAVGSSGSENLMGQIDENRYTSKQYNLDFSGNFTRRFMDNELEMALTLGEQTIWNEYASVGASSTNTLPFFDQITAGATRDATSYKSEKMIVGIFGQLNASYLDRYSATVSLRRDGSSTFGESKKFYTFPKASFTYNLSNEPFMEGLRGTINNIRIRGSWGEAGSPNLPGVYATNFLYGIAGFFDPWDRNTASASRGGFPGIRQGGGTSDEFIIAGSKDIKPELTSEREFGMDIGILDDKYGIEFTYFQANVFDMILNVPVAGSTGYDQALRNAAQMWNKGIELALHISPVVGENFSWTNTINYSTIWNEVTKLTIKPAGLPTTGDEYIALSGGFVGINNVAMVGKPLGVFFGYGWLRDEQGKILYSGDKVKMAGNEIVRGKNNRAIRDPNGVALPDDYGLGLLGSPVQDLQMQIIGDPNPDYQLSWRADISFYRDFTLSFLIDGVYGFDVWNGTRGAMYRHGTHGDTEDRDAPWFNFDGKPVIDEATGQQVTKLEWYRTYANGFNINEPHVEDGSFTKLREVTLEYRWGGLKEWNISNVIFQFSARNLYTWTKYSGYDPEVNTFSAAEGRGFDYFTLPQVRSYRLGLTIVY